MHRNDEAGVVWSPKWIGFLNLPGGLPSNPSQLYIVDITVTYLSYLPGRTCTLQVDNGVQNTVYVFSPGQQPTGVTHQYSVGVGVHEINYVCGPENNPRAYFLWDMGSNINENRDETVDILVSVYVNAGR